METIKLLPLAASLCLLIALAQAWLMTMVRYLKLTSIKKLFPNYHALVKSHIDYLMMGTLVFSIYLTLAHLQISLPNFISWLIFIGALYNPLGFLLQAIKPDIAEGEGFIHKTSTVLGFMPLTIGLGWAAIAIIIMLTNKL